MADHSILIHPESLKLSDINPLEIDGGQNNFVGIFDDTVSQSGRENFRNPDEFNSNPRLILQFDPNDTQTGILTVKWSISIMKVTPGTGVNRKIDNFDTPNIGTKTLSLNHGTGELEELEIALANFAGAIGGDELTLLIALDVSGSATGNIELSTITYKFSDS